MLLLTACQDGEARRRAEVQEVIASATQQIQRASAALGDPKKVDSARRELNQIISQLSDTQNAAPGQRAAAATLAASVHRRLAAISFAEALAVEADLRSRRTVLIGRLDSADQLDGMAAGLEAIDIGEADATLAAARGETEVALADAGDRLAELDGPIAEISRANRDDQDEAQRLREEAAVLRREAAELGAADGYGVFEEAQRIDREADAVELQLAHRELDLRYNYEPEHTLAQTRADRMNDRLSAIDAARQSLHDRKATADGEADTTREHLGEISASIEAGLEELQAAAAQVAELYDDAARELDRAAAKSKSAAGLADRDFADAARIEAAQAYHELGSLHRCRAHGLQDHIRLVQRVAEVTGGSGSAVDAVREAHREELNKAAEAYRNAGGELGRVSGRTGRERLEALKMAISELESSEPLEAPLPRAGRAPQAPSAAAASPDGGAASPEALMEAMLDRTNADPLALVYFGNVPPGQSALLAAFRAAEEVKVELIAALREQFADDLETADGSIMAAMANVDLSMGEVGGDRGTINRMISGMTVPMEIVRVDGRWYVEGSSAMQETTAQASALGMSPAELLQATTGFMRDLTRRLRAGEFGALQEVDMAFMQALQGNFGGS